MLKVRDDVEMFQKCADGECTGTIPGDVKTTGKLTSTDLTTNSITSVNTHVHGNENNWADTIAPK